MNDHPGPWLVLRGSAEHPLYLRKLEPDVGVVDWTMERPRAHRFADRSQADLVQRQIVGRNDRIAVAVVPA